MEEIKTLISNAYEIEIDTIEKIKNVYRITSGSRNFCFKEIKYGFGHFIFIISVMKHLEKNGFHEIPRMISNKEGKEYIITTKGYGYLTLWIDARECNFDNLIDLAYAVKKLSELHIKSEGFKVTSIMEPRYYWLKWIENFTTRKYEILDFKRRIEEKPKKTEFDLRYISLLQGEINRAQASINNIFKSNYLSKMHKDIRKNSFCHHDYAHHNILLDRENKVYVIDFDYCILDTHLHDLSSILIRTMKNGKWDMERCKYIFSIYNEVNPMEEEDAKIMAAFIEFPQEYWQLGIQCYWENKPWTEEVYLSKLNKIIADRDFRQEFVAQLASYKFRGD